VLNETNKILMVLRPYQFYAVEALIDRVKNSNKNGYIWHTTGSGKTLTSFKASQILMNLPQVKKVVFVVDRKDLDYQTNKEFNSFSKGCIDGTDNTKAIGSTVFRRYQTHCYYHSKTQYCNKQKTVFEQNGKTKRRTNCFHF
jgi:type I site-specific restriction-modification system R (restriction) subunit